MRLMGPPQRGHRSLAAANSLRAGWRDSSPHVEHLHLLARRNLRFPAFFFGFLRRRELKLLIWRGMSATFLVAAPETAFHRPWR